MYDFRVRKKKMSKKDQFFLKSELKFGVVNWRWSVGVSACWLGLGGVGVAREQVMGHSSPQMPLTATSTAGRQTASLRF